MLTLSGPRRHSWPFRLWVGAPVAGLVLAGSLGVGALLVKDLGSLPVAPRDGAPLCQAVEPSGVRVCVWPEHLPLVPEYSAVVNAVAAIEQEHRLGRTSVLSESRAGLGREGTYVILDKRPTLEDRVVSIAASMAVVSAQCHPVGTDFPEYSEQDYVASAVLERWWATKLADHLHVDLDESKVTEAPDLLNGMEPAGQWAWLRDVTVARRTCHQSFLPVAQ